MKKNKFFIAAATFALATAGLLATAANKKRFTAATSLYIYKGGLVPFTLFSGGTFAINNMTTTYIANRTLFVKVGNTPIVKAYAVQNRAVLSKTIFVKNY